MMAMSVSRSTPVVLTEITVGWIVIKFTSISVFISMIWFTAFEQDIAQYVVIC